MVCLGNICRSPTAHGVFQHLIRQQGLQHRVTVDSAGTGNWHIGEAPDPRTVLAASRRGYDLTGLTARQVTHQDYHRFDYLLAMDESNLAALEANRPADSDATIQLLLDYTRRGDKAVPDPYYKGARGFEIVLDLIEEASAGLLEFLVRQHSLA